MRLAYMFGIAAVAMVALSGSAVAQNAISAKAGMINVAEGDLFLSDAKGGAPQALQPKPGEIADIKEGQTLKTAEGRTEVLLTPGAFLRMAENSSFKMYSNRLSDVRLEVTGGEAMVEAVELLPDNQITMLVKDATVTLAKAGIYRFIADPAAVQVYTGEVVADYGGQRVTLRGGHQLVASANGWTVAKFDPNDTDALMRWAKRRSGYIAMANVSAARQSTPRNGLMGGSWAYNPYFGFATFIPWGDTMRSPFGYYYYTPSTVMGFYYPPVGYYSGGGHNGGGYYGGGNNSAASSTPTRSAAASYSPAPSVSSPAAVSSSSSAGSGAGASAGASRGSMGGGGGGASSGGGGGRSGRP